MPGKGSVATWKPLKGAYRLERNQKRAELRTAEDKAKQATRVRDRHQCRYPGCTWQKQGFALHVAHLEDKGMGGDKQLIRTERRKLISLCFMHHEGSTDSMHSGDLRIEPEDVARGTDGLCAFWVSDEQQRWKFVGVN